MNKVDFLSFRPSSPILIVEDEAFVRTAVTRALVARGHLVHTAEDGVAAVELFRAHHASIDVVVANQVFEHLKNIWPGSGWPGDLTLEQNLIDLGWHQKEFQRRRSFAYTVVTPTDSRVIGCVYINPTRKQGFAAVVYLWARESELPGGLEARLHSAVKTWVAKEWPFEKVAFPGRDIGWEAWRAIPERPEVLSSM